MVSSTQTSWPLGEEEEGGGGREERQDEQKKGKDRRGR